MTKRSLYFVHEGRAAYPEIAAYAAFFETAFRSQALDFATLLTKSDVEESVCWFMMGFYPHKVRAACVIHDYRSLSVGAGWRIKDALKKTFNAKPDIRIFQNKTLRERMGFKDDVPSLLLPMGVPSLVLEARALTPPDGASDFCYIGAMSHERKTTQMIDSFVRRFGDTKTFHLYGNPDPSIPARYKAYKNIVFCGMRAQADVFAALRATRVAVNYFPNHAPHLFQTPTKLLEYAALGCRILSNEHPQSRLTQQEHGITCLWGDRTDMFSAVPDALDWAGNDAFDSSPLLWPEIIAKSGIAEMLAQKGAT